jgi:hypothetical protein
MADWLKDQYNVPTRRACRCVLLSHSMYYYTPHKRDESLIRSRMTIPEALTPKSGKLTP